MRSDIIDRVITVIRSSVSDKRRLKELEEETGIPSGNWKNVWGGKQRPTAHMLEAIARRWPQYAFWLVTGITDEDHGHTAPPGAWTCGQQVSKPPVSEAAKEYFDLKIYAQDSLYGMSGAAESNYVEKKNPSAEELAAASRSKNSESPPEVQKLVELFFGQEPTVYHKKYSDLDYAIARIAFDKRLNSLKTHFSTLQDDPLDMHEYWKTLKAFSKRRRRIENEEDA